MSVRRSDLKSERPGHADWVVRWSGIRNLGFTACFPNALALYALKRPMLERLKQVGVDQLVLAVESGSAGVLRNIMRKPLNREVVERITRDCRELGIYTDCNLVIGEPGETAEHFEESRRFLRSTYANRFRPNVATPITGSELLKRAVDGGSDLLTRPAAPLAKSHNSRAPTTPNV